jgi:hypothetical protein
MSVEPARDSNGRWRRGASGNPDGRRAEHDPQRKRVRELARDHTEEAVEALREIMLDRQAQPMARVRAAEAILQRGWGTPTDEATLATLDHGDDEPIIIHFAPRLGPLYDEIDSELPDHEPPALSPPAAT